MTRTYWLPYFEQPRPDAQVRLFCLPYAGGGASVYRSWSKALPSWIEVIPVQYPGREEWNREPPKRAVVEMVEGLVPAVTPWLDKPVVLFGHSLGGIVAYELATALEASFLNTPACLVVSASRAPHLPHCPPIHHLPKAAFVEELRKFKGTPEEILHNAELMEHLLPILRADFLMRETYEFRPRPPLSCQVVALAGAADERISVNDLRGWKVHAGGGFQLEVFDGGHFFLRDVAPVLHRLLERVCGAFRSGNDASVGDATAVPTPFASQE